MKRVNYSIILGDTGLFKQKSMVKDIIPDIIEPVIQSISKELKLKNEKIKGNILQLLSTLGLVAPNETVLFLGGLVSDIQTSLKENNVS